MMTKSQRIHMLAELWPNACAAQGWSKSDNQKRYDLFAHVLASEDHINSIRHLRTLEAGRHISFNDFDNADFDAVKAHLKMLADSLDAAIETDQAYRGDGRRLTFHARMHHEPLLKALGIEHADAYLAAILRDRFKVKFISDLSQAPSRGKDQQRGPSQLMQYIFTVSRCIDRLRQKHKWTLHDLYTRAGLDCPCLACSKSRAPQISNPKSEIAAPAHSNHPF